MRCSQMLVVLLTLGVTVVMCDHHERDPYGRDHDGRDPYGRDPYGRDPYGRDPYGRDPYGRGPYGKDPYGRGPYEERTIPGGPSLEQPATQRVKEFFGKVQHEFKDLMGLGNTNTAFQAISFRASLVNGVIYNVKVKGLGNDGTMYAIVRIYSSLDDRKQTFGGYVIVSEADPIEQIQRGANLEGTLLGGPSTERSAPRELKNEIASMIPELKKLHIDVGGVGKIEAISYRSQVVAGSITWVKVRGQSRQWSMYAVLRIATTLQQRATLEGFAIASPYDEIELIPSGLNMRVGELGPLMKRDQHSIRLGGHVREDFEHRMGGIIFGGMNVLEYRSERPTDGNGIVYFIKVQVLGPDFVAILRVYESYDRTVISLEGAMSNPGTIRNFPKGTFLLPRNKLAFKESSSHALVAMRPLVIVAVLPYIAYFL